jgi:hypothetical protein
MRVTVSSEWHPFSLFPADQIQVQWYSLNSTSFWQFINIGRLFNRLPNPGDGELKHRRLRVRPVGAVEALSARFVYCLCTWPWIQNIGSIRRGAPGIKHVSSSTSPGTQVRSGFEVHFVVMY